MWKINRLSKFIKYITPVPPRSAEGLVAQTYAQMKRDLGTIAEPLSLHAPVPELLAGAWSLLCETLVAGQVRRALKEAVAATVSDLNRCPWCMDAHSLMVQATAGGATVTALTNHDFDQIPDPASRAHITWAATTNSPEAAILAAPPFAPREAPEIIGTAITFHYLNRMVNVLLVETFLPEQPWLRRAIKWAAPRLLSEPDSQAYAPGASLPLLPKADLPADLGWAESNLAVAGAFARFAAVVEQAGASALSPTARDIVYHHVQAWTGQDPGLSRKWVEEAISGHDEATQAAARLALLTALASHQIDEHVVLTFRAHQPGDEALVGALAWVSFTAVRRMGAWLWNPVRVEA